MALLSLRRTPRLAFGGALCVAVIAVSGWQLAPGRIDGAAAAGTPPTVQSPDQPVAPLVAMLPASASAGAPSPARGANAPDGGGTTGNSPKLVAPPQARDAWLNDPTTPFTYTVQPGDTLIRLARRFNTRVGKIVSLNPGLHPDRIKAGETLAIQANALDDVPLPPELASPAAADPEAEGGLRIWTPYRSQFDGDPYEGGNCGPAALGMAMSYFGEWWSTAGLRDSVNRVTGDWSYDGGSNWASLQTAAEERGFQTHGPYNAAGQLRYWDLDDLLAHTELGRPVLLLVRYRALPGHEQALWSGDHYIVFLGVTAAGIVVYHDPAFHEEDGAYRTMDQATLDRAWSHTTTGENRSAMALIWPP